MQFRAGAIYTVLFLVVAAGAYGAIATAESPAVTIDEADADHQLEVGDDFTVNDRTYNVSELTADSGTLESVNESAILEAEWSDGDTVQLEEEGTEYMVMINQPEEAGDDAEDAEEGNETEENGEEADDGEEADGEDTEGGEGDGTGEEGQETEEGDEAGEDEDAEGDEGEDAEGGEDDAETPEDEEAQPESFTLVESFDEEEYQVEEINERQYVIVEENGELTATPIEEFEEFDAQTYETGDSIEFYNEDSEEVVQGEVVDLTAETVTIEYEGEEVTEYDLANGQVTTVDGEEFGVYFPAEGQVYLTEDVESFEQQQAEIEKHGEQIHGLWWVVVLSLVTVSLIAGLAFMPVRG